MTGSVLAGAFMAPALGGTGLPVGQTIGGQVLAQAIGVGVVALWSGVVSLVLAKGVALLATHPGPLAGYAAILGGVPKITRCAAGCNVKPLGTDDTCK